jgi:hypothetical protein
MVYREGNVIFRNILFTVIIPLEKNGNIAVTIKDPEEEEKYAIK